MKQRYLQERPSWKMELERRLRIYRAEKRKSSSAGTSGTETAKDSARAA